MRPPPPTAAMTAVVVPPPPKVPRVAFDHVTLALMSGRTGS